MKKQLLVGSVAAGLLLGAFHTGAAEPASELVEVSKIDPSIHVELRYATTNNFTGKAIYSSPRCFVRRDVAVRLKKVQTELRPRGLGLKIWDGYRPFSVQKTFWKLFPDARYVAEPVEKNGKPVEGSKHNRGAAVDVTLIDLKTGNEVEMPTAFDDFSDKAHRDYDGSSKGALRNMKILEDTMKAQGFEPFPTEWWHFDGPGWQRYEISDFPVE